MFLDENGVPFMGGTYFPKESKHGLPSFKEVLQKISDAYKDQSNFKSGYNVSTHGGKKKQI